MSLSGPKSGQLAQLPLLLEDSKRKDEIFLFTQDWVLSLDINRFQIENQINKAITSCFYAVKPRVVYSTRAMLPSAKKDSVPTTQKSCVVYEFSCRCEARYVGRTTQRLADRIKQHVPTSIRKKSNTVREQPPRLCKNNNSKINCESAIGQHLLTNPECAKTYTDDNFRIIGHGRSSFHLSVLESVYIKTQNPVLCKQKDFIFSLGIFK